MNHLNHINHTNMGQLDAYMAPLWLIYALSAVFFAGALFYLYRLLCPVAVKKVYGYYDWQNEVGHGICMLAMAFAMAPTSLQLPSQLWAVTLLAGGTFFTVRAATWGRQLPYNKWWWDWAHAGMLLGMALMFLPMNVGKFAYVLDGFWLWFAVYYTYSLCHDLKEGKALYIGSDVSHLLMGAVMFVMTAAPMALMAPGASMPGMICSGDNHEMHVSQPSSDAAAPGPDSAAPAVTELPGVNKPGMNKPGMDMPGMDMPGMDMHQHHDHGKKP